MPTFWYFILFSIFEMKLLIIAWRARYWNSLQDQEQTRRAMANFYLKLCKISNSPIKLILTIRCWHDCYPSFVLQFCSWKLVPPSHELVPRASNYSQCHERWKNRIRLQLHVLGHWSQNLPPSIFLWDEILLIIIYDSSTSEVALRIFWNSNHHCLSASTLSSFSLLRYFKTQFPH